MPRILIISFSDLSRDPRVRRQLFWLKDEADIVAVGHENPDIEGVKFVKVDSKPSSLISMSINAILLFFRLFGFYDSRRHNRTDALATLQKRRFDVVIVNDIDAMPFALEVSGNAEVLLDLHEYAPREFEDSLIWRAFFQNFKEYLCSKYISRSDAVITVSDGIAEEYSRNFGTRPDVITNASDFVDLAPSSVSDESIRIIHHGGAMRSRRLETMIRMMDHLDQRFSLDFMLMPTDKKYLSELKALSQNNPRVRFLSPVAFEDIVSTLNDYDVGLYILEPISFNTRYALPNKIFEYIQARLCVAIGPSIEMAHLVRETGCGVVSADFSPESLASILASLTAEQLRVYKEQSHKAAWELSSEVNQRKFRELVAKLADAGGPKCVA